MQYGVVFPQTEFGNDTAAIRDYAQTVEGIGLGYIDAYDHILGANPDRPGGWRGSYTYQAHFIEPFLLYTYMAPFTTKIIFATNIIILPQRQTALVAKQAATVDVLSGGRLRLGVGLGWNPIEYTALNEDFHNRGKRIEEQVQVLRLLWTQPLVNFDGKWHHIPDAGINPLPIQRPIPVWFGGSDERAIRRAARLGDGWMINVRIPDQAKPLIDIVNRTLTEQNRAKDKFGIEARIQYGSGKPEDWLSGIREWQALGATCVSLNTMGANLQGAGAHIAAVRQFGEAVAGAG